MLQDRKKLRRALTVTLLAIIAGNIVTMGALLVFQYFMIEIPTVFRALDNDNLLLYNFIVSHLFAGAVIFAMLTPLKKKNFSIDKMTVSKFIKYTVVTFGVSYLLNLFTQFVVVPIVDSISPMAVNPLDMVIEEQPIAMLMAFIVILGPIAEELIFRQVILSRLLVLGQRNAIILQGVLFGLFHQNLYQFFYTTGIGIVLGYITVRYGSVKYAVYIHMIANFVGSVLSTFATDSEGAIMAFGLFMVVSIVYFIVYYAKRRKTVVFSDEVETRGNMGYALASPINILLLLYLSFMTVFNVV